MSEGTLGLLIGGLVSGGVGGLLLVLGIFFWSRTRAFLSTAQPAKGTVTQMLYTTDSEGGGGYSPVYKFTTLQGQQIEVSDSMSSNPPQFQVGQVIDILYDPANPSKARINKKFNLYFVPGLLGGMGLIFGCVGIAFLFGLGISSFSKLFN